MTCINVNVYDFLLESIINANQNKQQKHLFIYTHIFNNPFMLLTQQMAT